MTDSFTEKRFAWGLMGDEVMMYLSLIGNTGTESFQV